MLIPPNTGENLKQQGHPHVLMGRQKLRPLWKTPWKISTLDSHLTYGEEITHLGIHTNRRLRCTQNPEHMCV